MPPVRLAKTGRRAQPVARASSLARRAKKPPRLSRGGRYINYMLKALLLFGLLLDGQNATNSTHWLSNVSLNLEILQKRTAYRSCSKRASRCRAPRPARRRFSMMPRSAMTFSAFALPKPGSERMKVETLMRPTIGSSMRAIASAGESRPAFRSARTTARAARVSFALSKRCLALLGRELVEAHRITSNHRYFMLDSSPARLHTALRATGDSVGSENIKE